MFFSKRIFLFFGFFFLSHCGLEIGEEAPPLPIHILHSASGYCSKLDYKEELKFYFLEAHDGESDGEISSGERFQKALDCLSSVILRNKDLFDNEYFEKQELINLLNHDFVRTENVQPIIDHIIQPDNFNNYLFIKDNTLNLIEKFPKKEFIKSDTTCQEQKQIRLFF